MTTSNSRERRRRIRRSSPDAPQGVAPVVIALSAFAAIVVLTAGAIGFPWSKSSSVTSPRASRVTHEGGKATKGGDGVTTVVIRGSTSLFVSTTTPITTTSSTSSTSTTTTLVPRSKRLTATPDDLVFDPDHRMQTFTVQTRASGAVTFVLTGLPDGFTASPPGAKVTRSHPATVVLYLDDPSIAQSGTVVIVGTDHSRLHVSLNVLATLVNITSVNLSDDQPSCNVPVGVAATVADGSPTSVRITTTVDGSTVVGFLTPQGGGIWKTTLPGRPAGSHVTGSVQAFDVNGQSPAVPFAYTVSGGQSC